MGNRFYLTLLEAVVAVILITVFCVLAFVSIRSLLVSHSSLSEVPSRPSLLGEAASAPSQEQGKQQ
jgi:type II secretory pathway component PulJ